MPTPRSWLLDRDGGSDVTSIDIVTILAARVGAGGGRRLVCARCGRAITWERARVEIGGKHEHVKENPHGLVFRIGCFRPAPGCVGHGPEVSEDTWFDGYSWQIALCRGCGAHLGWGFRAGSDRFHGLIVDRLRLAEDPRPS